MLLDRGHAAGVDELRQTLQVGDRLVHQLRVSGDGLQPGEGAAEGGELVKHRTRCDPNRADLSTEDTII